NASGQVLKDCASSASNYYDVDGVEISDAFNSIHHKPLTKGIGAFERNVNSMIAKGANRATPNQRGTFFREKYHSHNLPQKKDLIRSQCYIHGQHEHHRTGQTSRHNFHNSASTLCDRLPCGLIEQILELAPHEDLSNEALAGLHLRLLDRVVSLAAGPTIPEGYTQVVASADNPGTLVVVHQ
ncbi:MAG: hypothetical protein AAF485_20580, partial [Chloroflexota bacterium]